MNEIIKNIEAAQLKAEVPQFNVGDTVRVHGKIKEGNRERIQIFEGVVLKKQGGSNRATFTVRKNSNGIGVEKTWPLHSPNVEKVESKAGDGTVTATFTSLSPVAFVVDKATAASTTTTNKGTTTTTNKGTTSSTTASASTTSPKTGETNVMMYAGIVAVAAVAGMAVTRRKRA